MAAYAYSAELLLQGIECRDGSWPAWITRCPGVICAVNGLHVRGTGKNGPHQLQMTNCTVSVSPRMQAMSPWLLCKWLLHGSLWPLTTGAIVCGT